MGFNLLYEREFIESHSYYQKVTLERSVLFQRLMGQPDRKKNNPEKNNEGLYIFPKGTYQMGKAPYMEASIGIENIFKAVRIDYVWRLNYLKHPGIQNSGIRATIALTF